MNERPPHHRLAIAEQRSARNAAAIARAMANDPPSDDRDLIASLYQLHAAACAARARQHLGIP